MRTNWILLVALCLKQVTAETKCNPKSGRVRVEKWKVKWGRGGRGGSKPHTVKFLAKKEKGNLLKQMVDLGFVYWDGIKSLLCVGGGRGGLRCKMKGKNRHLFLDPSYKFLIHLRPQVPSVTITLHQHKYMVLHTGEERAEVRVRVDVSSWHTWRRDLEGKVTSASSKQYLSVLFSMLRLTASATLQSTFTGSGAPGPKYLLENKPRSIHHYRIPQGR